MVSYSARPGWVEAKETCPGGCQSWVAKAAENRPSSSRLIGASTASPFGTGNSPPGMKQGCASITPSTSSRARAPPIAPPFISDRGRSLPYPPEGSNCPRYRCTKKGRQFMRRLRRALLGLLLSAAALPLAARAATFRWANNGDVTGMDPDTLEETVQLSFLANIYEPLVQRDQDLKLIPGLAVKWRQVSPTVWRFHLRPGVKWQDGTPFTAADVVFSVHRMEAKTSHMRDVLGMVADVRAVDPLTVEFTTKHPDPIFPQEQTNLLI